MVESGDYYEIMALNIPKPDDEISPFCSCSKELRVRGAHGL
jgi:hypothetical protein